MPLDRQPHPCLVLTVLQKHFRAHPDIPEPIRTTDLTQIGSKSSVVKGIKGVGLYVKRRIKLLTEICCG